MEMHEVDLLYGVKAIASHLGMSGKQVYHLHDQRHGPTFKVGGKVCATRSALADHFATLAKEAANGIGR